MCVEFNKMSCAPTKLIYLYMVFHQKEIYNFIKTETLFNVYIQTIFQWYYLGFNRFATDS